MIYKICDSNIKGDKPFIVVSGKAIIKENDSLRDDRGNVFLVKNVISICGGCTACVDTMINVDITEYSGELGKEIEIC